MAITQQVIIHQLPTIITSESNRVVLVLRSLVAYGWGIECELYKKLDELWDVIHNLEHSEYYALAKFNRDTFLVSDFDCRICYDSGIASGTKGEELPCSCTRGEQS